MEPSPDLTEDALIGGAVRLHQPRKGFRAGTDSVLLGAVLANEKPKGEALEFGCGAGGALFVAATHLQGWQFTGIEQDAAYLQLAEQNAALNGLQHRVTLREGALPKAIEDQENRYDLVFSNPPYFAKGTTVDPGLGKDAAYIERVSLDDWLKGMLFAAKPRAPVVLIHRAANLAKILARLDRQAGDITVMPIRPHPGAPANRVLVRGRKGLRSGEVKVLAGLDVYDSKGGPHSERAKAAMMGDALKWT